MLTALSVRNIVLIDRLDLQFGHGLSVLTGETGAGKSILLDALTLALGGRGDQSLVRKGAESGQVSAVLSLAIDHPARKVIQSEAALAGCVGEGEDLILRRVQFSDGRTRAFINDQAISVQLLKKVGQELVEIHGQHDERALVDVNSHRILLDAFGNNAKGHEQVVAAFREVMKIQRQVDELEQAISTAAREEEFARHAVEELNKLAPEIGEEEKLAQRRRELMALERAADDLRGAEEILSGPSAPSSSLSTLLRRLQRKEEEGGGVFLPLIEQVDGALVALDGTLEALEDIRREMNFDPQELNDVEERLFALRAMARKYHAGCDELGLVLKKYEGDLAAFQSGTEELEEFRVQLSRALEQYHKAARGRSAQRQKAATLLEGAIGKELPDLKLGSARFIVDRKVDETRLAMEGYDFISFHVQTNPGTQSGPMLKVASGGELSRILLALKVVLAERASAPVLIFDEIDTGVGGAVADAMGRRLARLADCVQVLSVTHAPQVAARASRHMLIEKLPSENGQGVRTHVRVLDEEEKGEEIARMLAGAQVSDEARAAAKRLISEVG